MVAGSCTSGSSASVRSEPGHPLLAVRRTDPRNACYVLEDGEAEARLASVALLEISPEADRADRVLNSARGTQRRPAFLCS